MPYVIKHNHYFSARLKALKSVNHAICTAHINTIRLPFFDVTICETKSRRRTANRIKIEDLVTAQFDSKKIIQNKPSYTGFAVLKLSKVLMYEFHYEVYMHRNLAQSVSFHRSGEVSVHPHRQPLLSYSDERFARHGIVFFSNRSLQFSQRECHR